MADPTLTEAQAAEITDTLVTSFVDRKGATTITFADQSVTFEKLGDVLDFIDKVRQRAAGPRTRYAATSKGI